MIGNIKITLCRSAKVELCWFAACGSLGAQMRRVVHPGSVSRSLMIGGVENTLRRSEKVEFC